jgi:hypothetical protein
VNILYVIIEPIIAQRQQNFQKQYLQVYILAEGFFFFGDDGGGFLKAEEIKTYRKAPPP